MTLKTAIRVLERHNEWRRGGEGDMVDPKKLGRAIDVILEHLKNAVH